MKGTENDRRLTIQAFEAIGQETYFLVKENTASVRTLTCLIREALWFVFDSKSKNDSWFALFWFLIRFYFDSAHLGLLIMIRGESISNKSKSIDAIHSLRKWIKTIRQCESKIIKSNLANQNLFFFSFWFSSANQNESIWFEPWSQNLKSSAQALN